MSKKSNNIEKTEQWYREQTLEGYRRVAAKKSQRQLQWAWDRAIARLPESKPAFDPISGAVTWCAPETEKKVGKKK